MKKIAALVLTCCLITGCSAAPVETTVPAVAEIQVPETEAIQFRPVGEVVAIQLQNQNITVAGDGSGVFVSRDIVYYEDKAEYDSGNPYGEGDAWEMHTAQEAAAHLVVNITKPGTYCLSGKLDKGQIRIDLGEDAYEDPDAVVNLILDGVEITCTVGPAILFQNVYEYDGNWSVDNAKPDVDTTAAGANLILAEGSQNVVNGSHVAKIYKDKEGGKKLWKQDGAVYSYMSMNVYGPGGLDIYADNEGLDTELHLTIWGGDIVIRSGNDGINTNEDGVSVTTILGGKLHVLAGLRDEGDGIDSNGYLVIRGGTVIASAHPASDAGLDSDLGSFIHGGTVIALGSAMDWAESDSDQVTMNLQFARQQSAGSDIVITGEDGTVIFSYDPRQDAAVGENLRAFQGVILSCPQFQVGENYQVFAGGVQMAYTGTDVMRFPGGMGGPGGGQRPQGGGPNLPGGVTPPGDMPQPPEGDFTIPPQPGTDIPSMPDGGTMPSMPQGEFPQGGPMGPGGFGGYGTGEEGQKQTIFFMQDKVNFFSGLTQAE